MMVKATRAFANQLRSNSQMEPAHLTGIPHLSQNSCSFSVIFFQWVGRASMTQSKREKVNKKVNPTKHEIRESIKIRIYRIPIRPRRYQLTKLSAQEEFWHVAIAKLSDFARNVLFSFSYSRGQDHSSCFCKCHRALNKAADECYFRAQAKVIGSHAYPVDSRNASSKLAGWQNRGSQRL